MNNSLLQHNPMTRRARLALIVLSGLLCGLSQPFAWPAEPANAIGPSYLFACLVFVAPIPLIWATDQLGPRRAYVWGLFGFFVHMSVVFYWIVIPVVQFGKLPMAVGIAAWFGVALLQALILAFIPALVSALRLRSSLPNYLLWPIAWTSIELARDYIPFNGFSWASLGSGLVGAPVLVQSASLFGVHGLTFAAVLVAATLAQCIRGRRYQPARSRQMLAAIAFAWALCVFYGALRMKWLDELQQSAATTTVAILQGNIEQGIKNRTAQNREYILNKYRVLTEEAQKQKVDIIVWPEAAYPTYFAKGSMTMAGRGFGDGGKGIYTLAGVVFYQRDPADSQMTFYNSMVVLDPEHSVMGSFDKRHLVPFGEYVPWPFVRLLKKLVPGVGRTAPGDLVAPLHIGRVRVGGLICYEGIFSRYSRAFTRAGANLLVNVTNDAWYGYTSAPHQHIAFYALRAIETGRSMVRASNTGISATFGPDGKIHGATRLFEDAVVVESVTLHEFSTLYILVGDVVAWTCVLLILLIYGKSIWRRRPATTLE